MKVTFPAMRGSMGGRTFYSTQMPLSVIPRLLSFGDSELDARDREQRKLNLKRVPDIASYIKLNDGEGYLFSSITASHKGGVTFAPLPGHESFGFIEVDLSEATFLINDGQHRVAAIESAVKTMPSLGEDRISVLLFPYENKARAQQMFSDLNRFVKKTSKSLDILFDQRDVIAQVTRDVSESVPAFRGLVEEESATLSASSKKLFTLAALHDSNAELLRDFSTTEMSRNELSATALEFWNAIASVIPDWARVRNEEIPAREFRMENISAHSVVLRALGATGSELMREDPTGWKQRLEGLRQVDWRKSNSEWENVNIVANSVVSNRQARAATKAYIKERLGMVLSDAELKAVRRPVLTQVA
jgi:DNA sulfur modification protein DndB